ncbi:MAG TPA: DUF4038 domain-containing protein [Polyangiaceae bacterium]|nr:DUF4038 domain-containing protein [Polyangiaceae bacterium]
MLGSIGGSVACDASYARPHTQAERAALAGDEGSASDVPSSNALASEAEAGDAALEAAAAGALLVSASSNGRYLVDGEGNPFLLVGQASWALATRLQQPDAEFYLNDQATRGYNTVVVKFIDSAWTDTFPKNAYGELPFSGTLSGGHADWTTPNEAYWAQVDWVVEQCAARDMLVIASPIFLGYAPPQGQYEDMVANGHAGATAYGTFLGERYRDYDNILWLVGGDKTAGTMLAGDALAMFTAFTNALKAADTRHMVSAHFLQEQQSYQYPGPWQDYSFLYTGLITHEAALGGWEFRGPVPMFLGEARYVDAPWDGTPPTLQQLRGQAWQVMTSGGSGFVFGDEHVWHFDAQNAYADGPWRENLDTAASHHQILIKNLFASRDWHLLRPDRGNLLVTAGRGTRGQLSYVTASRASDNSFAVVYIPSGGTITVNLRRLSAPATASWYDPTDGRYVAIGTGLRGTRTFTTPGSNAAGDNDWVLLLETP